MEIVKYNRGNTGYTIGSAASKAANSSSSSSSTSTKAPSDIDNYLWGNHNDGTEDIEDTIFVNGSVYAMPSKFEGRDEDEDDDRKEGDIENYEQLEFEPFEDDNGGNVYAENLVKSFGDIKAEEKITGKNVLVDNNLNVDGKGTFKAVEYQSGYNLPANDDSSKLASTEWVRNLVEDHKTLTIKDSKNKELGKFDNTADKTITIKNYDDEISALDGRVTTNEGDITNIYELIDNIEGNVDGVAGDIPTKVSLLENDKGYITLDDLPENDKYAPVILFSGIIHSNNNDGSLTYLPWVVRPLCYSQHTGVNNIELDYLVVGGEKKCTLVVKVNAKEGWSVKPTSMHSTVSLNCHCNPAVDFGGNRRSQGYWTTGGVFPTGDLYVQVWRTGDGNNDTTVNDLVAYSAQEINLTIFGTAYKN